PSELNVKFRTRSVCPLRILNSSRLAASRSQTVPSSLPTANRVPSWLYATHLSLDLLKVRLFSCWPVPASQRRTVPSWAQEPIRVQRGREAIQKPVSVWP